MTGEMKEVMWLANDEISWLGRKTVCSAHFLVALNDAMHGRPPSERRFFTIAMRGGDGANCKLDVFKNESRKLQAAHNRFTNSISDIGSFIFAASMHIEIQTNLARRTKKFQ